MFEVSVVIPNWNGERWLSQCLDALSRQTQLPAEVIVVDNGSSDGSLNLLHSSPTKPRVIELGRNTGFAYAANRGIEAASTEAVALINTDVVLSPEWITRMSARLEADSGLAAVACKMLQMGDEGEVYDAGDILRRDGVCVQRGRFRPDDGSYDAAGEIFAACAGAALYRRSALQAVGGFDERLVIYLEDVDLGLRLRLAGWRCGYEPVEVAHAGGGSAAALEPPLWHWIERNTLLIVAKAFPVRWLPLVVYRQLGWAWHAARERRLRTLFSGLIAALPVMPTMLRERRQLRDRASVPIEEAVPSKPIRGARA
jgi:GT2 family glycosyltransferase